MGVLVAVTYSLRHIHWGLTLLKQEVLGVAFAGTWGYNTPLKGGALDAPSASNCRGWRQTCHGKAHGGLEKSVKRTLSSFRRFAAGIALAAYAVVLSGFGADDPCAGQQPGVLRVNSAAGGNGNLPGPLTAPKSGAGGFYRVFVR